MPPVDYLIMESTYGDRLHKDVDAVADKLADIVNRTCRARRQDHRPGVRRGPHAAARAAAARAVRPAADSAIPIFVDSPLAVNVTEIFRKHAECFDAETPRVSAAKARTRSASSACATSSDAGESKALNDLRGPFIIISASGMCEAGRILHHLKNNIEDPRNTVLVTGFMAEHTLGRKIVDKLRGSADLRRAAPAAGRGRQAERTQRPRRPARAARLAQAHGQGPEEGLPGPRRAAQSAALAKAIGEQYGIETVVPERGETAELL